VVHELLALARRHGWEAKVRRIKGAPDGMWSQHWVWDLADRVGMAFPDFLNGWVLDAEKDGLEVSACWFPSGAKGKRYRLDSAIVTDDPYGRSNEVYMTSGALRELLAGYPPMVARIRERLAEG
jgi:hypothetical protein